MIKPIETYYNGFHFRSRLEARYAVFLDAIGAKWEYEPQGYKLGDNLYYLPDFLVHDVKGRYCGDLYIEVKGKMTDVDALKIRKFSGLEDGKIINPILVVGSIPSRSEYDISGYDWYNMNMRSYHGMNGCDIHEFNYETIDLDYFTCYPYQYKNRAGLYLDDENGNYTCSDINIEETLVAYDIARQMRF